MSSESAWLRLKAFNESDPESSARVDAFLNLNQLYDIAKEEDWYAIGPKVASLDQAALIFIVLTVFYRSFSTSMLHSLKEGLPAMCTFAGVTLKR